MRRNGPRIRAAEALAQREADHQRWADDGGASPDTPEPGGRTRGPVTDDRPRLPVLLVYHRPARESRRPTGATGTPVGRGGSDDLLRPGTRTSGLMLYRGH